MPLRQQYFAAHSWEYRLYRLIFSAIALLRPCSPWQQWDYKTYTTDDWRDVWGFADGPRSRRGHSMVLFNLTKVILFGGRDNDVHRPHLPKTYEVVEEDGAQIFSTYEDKPVRSNYVPSCKPLTVCVPLTNALSGNSESCSYSWDHLLREELIADQEERIEEECGYVPVGLYYNDVWVYDVECKRSADLGCSDNGWRVLSPGIRYGGCRDEDEERVCDVPSERWGHGAAMIDDSNMVVYGGFSHECEDYCEDLWLLDLNRLAWKRILAAESPGKRWKFSMIRGEENPETGNRMVILFGGHRIWHGFASDNDEDNRWSSHDILPKGGFLDDLWIFSLSSDTNAPKGTWLEMKRKASCETAPGIAWETRNDIYCEVQWPKARYGHVAVFDDNRQGMWIYGGYTTSYPYPSSDRESFVPYPTHPFFLDDMWFYNVSTGYWEEMKPVSLINPGKRTDHSMFLSRDILILFGGYSDNQHLNDTWFYYIKENRWLEKTEFVHAFFLPDCSDDLQKIEDTPDCVELKFPPVLRRSNITTRATRYQEVLPYKDQPGYTPDPDYPLYFGIVDDALTFVEDLRQKFLFKETYDDDRNRIWLQSEVKDGTPIAPNAATALRQYARPRKVIFNSTTTLEVWEWCVSAVGSPTRNKLIDGIAGRSNSPIFIRQPKRKSPGWDGCREFEWKYPPSRSDHMAIFIEKYHMAVLYGGVGFKNGPHPREIDTTHNSQVLDDLWTFNMRGCPKNCSDHGVCSDGFCRCDPGYYGLDCSNYTCPGSVCYYDLDHVQHCTHCCHDGYSHTDGDIYIAGVRKVPCRLDDDGRTFMGHSEGVCDGFGTCQCAPPFIGEDCSIKDCKHNCSFNGYCSVEYPVSRCMCKRGYFGDYCQHIECINNCSYPNGQCDYTTGQCSCAPIYDPYNVSKIWTQWRGEDCSYLSAWSASHRLRAYWIIVYAVFRLAAPFI